MGVLYTGPLKHAVINWRIISQSSAIGWERNGGKGVVKI